MHQLFISYRRKDIQTMMLIYERLRGLYGEENVFFDKVDIRVADKWHEKLENALDSSDALVVVIGKNWVDVSDQGGLVRLKEEKDWVRRELETALDLKVPIFPILIDVNAYPAEDLLPPSLHSIRKIQYTKIKIETFDRDIKPLLESLKRKGIIPTYKATSPAKKSSKIEGLVDSAQLNQLKMAFKLLLDFARDFHPTYLKSILQISEDINLDNPTKEELQQMVNILQEKLNQLKSTPISDELLNSPKDPSKEEDKKPHPLRNKYWQVPNNVVVHIQGLQKKYTTTNFSLNVPSLKLQLGTITGLVGENATGKSTLLRIIAGELAHDKGELTYPKWQSGNSYRWAALKKKIAYVPQFLPDWYGSLEENLKYEAVLHGIKGEKNKEALKFIISRLGLQKHKEKSWIQLSGGYKLRFALAKALIKQPDLLVLDEPLAHLDIKTQATVLTDLKSLAESAKYPISVIISSQHLEAVEAITDQMLFMRDGLLERWDKGNNQSFHLFELICDGDPKIISEKIKDFGVQDLKWDGMRFFVKTETSKTVFDLLLFLKAQDINVQQFSDISTSVKNKFYEANL